MEALRRVVGYDSILTGGVSMRWHNGAPDLLERKLWKGMRDVMPVYPGA